MTEAFLEWGAEGAEAAVARGDIVVLIDVLRFTSATVAAVSNDFVVIPAINSQDANILASQYDARLNGEGLCALSPNSFVGKKPCRVVLPSPHGATLCFHVARAESAFVASFLNAPAASRMVQRVSDSSGQDVSIIASGEIGGYRPSLMLDFERNLSIGNEIFCFEDYICAGSISRNLLAKKSASLLRAENAFMLHSKNLRNTLLKCASGRYLVECGFASDVEFCSQFDKFSKVPVARNHDADVIIFQR